MSNDDSQGSFDFDDLIGEECDFYGVQGNCFRLDDMVYEIVENHALRGSYEVIERPELVDSFSLPVARVVIEEDDCTYRLIDLHDGHEWLRFGADYRDAWTPLFIFDYTPKAQEEL